MIFFRTLLILSSLLLVSSLLAQEETAETPPVDSEATTTPATPPETTEATEAPAAPTVTEEKAIETKEQAPAPVVEEKKEVKGIVSDEAIAPIKVRLKKKKEKDPPDTYVQQAERYKLPENYKYIDLNTAIEQGLRESADEKIRVLKSELFDLDLKGAKMSFWMPNVQLEMTTEKQRLGRLKKGSKEGAGSNSSPTGTVGLSLGDYTVFNWGKDYLQYLNKSREVSREKQILGEEKRNLRHRIILTYFNLVALKNSETIVRNNLRQASFIFRFNKERVAIGKASKQEYYESRAQYLKAQTQYQQVTNDIELLEEKLATLLQERHGISFYLRQELLFKKITIPIDEAVSLGKAKNSEILTAKNKMELASNNYELAVKESLPLPKLSINLGAYTNSFSKNGSRTIYKTQPNNSDIELVATVNATWDILGPRGIFNSNEREKAYLQKELALRTLTNSKDQTEETIRQYHKKILSEEKLYLIAEAKTGNLQKNFDNLLDSYVNKRANLNDLRKALDELTEGQLYFEQVKLEHLQTKILLAQAMGMEDLPGESFDKLAIGVNAK